ncbi:MAG: crossover junction endodeoxyribonuclease RuvC [Patescibacteria group bacterium]|nr:crossover junction endodeoxyribonuclease RuvC [Patescibacteria group bacterium]
MIILGIDPGTASTGWGVVRKIENFNNNNGVELLGYGCVRTPAGMEMPKRLLMLKNELSGIIKKHKPAAIVVERIFFNTNVKTAISVGQARGVVMLLSAQHKADFFEYTALQAKKELTGYGRSDKLEMQKATTKYLGLLDKIKPDDAADALALAIFHCLKISYGTK